MTDLLAILVPVIGRALLHFLWQGALIGLLAALALQLLRHARPQARYAVACLALLACVLAPLVGVWLQLAGAGEGATPAVAVTATRVAPVASAPSTLDLVGWAVRVDDALPWVVALWAAGACVLSLRMAMGVWWIRRLCAAPQSQAQVPWQARLDVLAARFGLRRAVALRLVDALATPASAGWWRPVVLLPTALLTRLPADLIEALLAHELAHIRRHDYLVNLLQGAVEALLFYHPVTWWLSRRIRIEREHIADRLAAEATGEPRRLALALSELSEVGASCCPTPHLAQAAHGGHLMSRIEQLVRPGRHRIGGGIAFPLLGLAAAGLAFYAHAQIGPDHPRITAQVAAVGGNTLRLHDGATRDAYALVRKGRQGYTMSGSSMDMDDIEAARRRLDGDFLWFRKDDQAYVVVDPGTVGRAKQAWREADELGVRMEALGSEMKVHGDKMEALGTQMEQLSVRHGQTPAMDAAARRMEALGREQQSLGAAQAKLAAALAAADEAQQEPLARQMDALGEQQDALARQMDEQAQVMEAEGERLEQQMQPMEALGRQMDEASKPMEALGRQMDALGTQMERLSDQAERETRQLIDDALAKGLAMPAPARR